MRFLVMFATLFVGALMPVQAILNARLGRQNGGPLIGALVSFLVGAVCLVVLNLIVNYPAMQQMRSWSASPWYLWVGGILGAMFVGYITWVSPQQGVALTFALAVSGQIFASMVIDHYGLFGTAIRTITWEKIAGALLILGGLLLIKK